MFDIQPYTEKKYRRCSVCNTLLEEGEQCPFCGSSIQKTDSEPVERIALRRTISEEEYEKKISSYDSVDNFSGILQLAEATCGKKTGLINRNGDIVIPLNFESIDDRWKVTNKQSSEYHIYLLTTSDGDIWMFDFAAFDFVKMVSGKKMSFHESQIIRQADSIDHYRISIDNLSVVIHDDFGSKNYKSENEFEFLDEIFYLINGCCRRFCSLKYTYSQPFLILHDLEGFYDIITETGTSVHDFLYQIGHIAFGEQLADDEKPSSKIGYDEEKKCFTFHLTYKLKNGEEFRKSYKIYTNRCTYGFEKELARFESEAPQLAQEHEKEKAKHKAKAEKEKAARQARAEREKINRKKREEEKRIALEKQAKEERLKRICTIVSIVGLIIYLFLKIYRIFS